MRPANKRGERASSHSLRHEQLNTAMPTLPWSPGSGGDCLALFNPDGSNCSPKCSVLGRCDHGCLNWLPSVYLHGLIKKQHKWLLYVGDSDVRGMVLHLLQIFAEVGYGKTVAANNSSLWLGKTARVCHIDASFDASGRVRLPIKMVECRQRPGDAVYAMFGSDYHLNSPSDQSLLRVTYISTLHRGQLVDTLHALSSVWKKATPGHRPDFLFVSPGSWSVPNRTVLPDASQAVAALDKFAAENMADGSKLIFGTVLASRRPSLHEDALQLLNRRRWFILNRWNASLSHSASPTGQNTGMVLSNGHPPHLLNHADLQRMFALGRSLGGDYGETIGSRSGKCWRYATFSPSCAGFFTSEPKVEREWRFLEAWQHLCSVDLHSNDESTSTRLRGPEHYECRILFGPISAGPGWACVARDKPHSAKMHNVSL